MQIYLLINEAILKAEMFVTTIFGKAVPFQLVALIGDNKINLEYGYQMIFFPRFFFYTYVDDR